MADDYTPDFGDMTPMDPIPPPDYQMPVINPFPDIGTLNPNDPIGQLPLGSTSGGLSGLQSLMRMLGMTGANGAGGIGSLLPLLSLLGIGAGGFLSHNATTHATDQMTGAVKDANDAITKILGGQQAAYAPYATMGANAAGALPGAVFKPIGGNFKPIQASAAAPPYAGAGATLSSLMRR